MPRMTGAQCFAEMMQGYDVSHIFFVPAFMLKAFAEMEDRPIRRVMVHGEKAAAYMADGYARASGKPGVCMAQMIGASNLAAGLRDGFMAGAPIIAITGGPTPQSRHRHAYQELDDITQFDTVTKFNAQIDHVTRMPDLLRQAFRVATSGAPGPVHLRVQSHLGQITEEEAELDPLVEAAYRCAPAFRPEPQMEHVRQALVVLSKAERPVIVAGGGVVRSGAQAELVELAEKLSDAGRDLAQRQGGDRRGSSIGGRRAGRLFARLRQPRALPKRTWSSSSAATRAARSPTTGCFLASAPRSSSSTSIRRSWAGTIRTPCRSWATPRSRCGG